MQATSRDIIVAVITGITVLLGQFFVSQGQVASARPEEMRVLYKELGDMRSEIERLNGEVLSLKGENTLLRIQLRDEYKTSPRGTLWSYMEALDVPAWCKEWAPPDFKMAYINHSYETFYGITKERYIGSSDFELHPVGIAQAWHENDLRSYQRRGFVRFTEKVLRPNGQEQDYDFWKFYIQLPDAGELICGIQITDFGGLTNDRD